MISMCSTYKKVGSSIVGDLAVSRCLSNADLHVLIIQLSVCCKSPGSRAAVAETVVLVFAAFFVSSRPAQFLKKIISKIDSTFTTIARGYAMKWNRS